MSQCSFCERRKNRSLEKIRGLISDCRRRGKKPILLHIDLETEVELLGTTAWEVGGDLASRIFQYGARSAFDGRIYGIRVAWDAATFKLDEET